MDNKEQRMIEYIMELKVEQSKNSETLEQIQRDLAEHRIESKETRKEIEQAKGSIRAIKWLAGPGVLGFLYTLFEKFVR